MAASLKNHVDVICVQPYYGSWADDFRLYEKYCYPGISSSNPTTRARPLGHSFSEAVYSTDETSEIVKLHEVGQIEASFRNRAILRGLTT